METVKNIQLAIDYIENNIFDNLESNVIAKQAYLSPSHFQRIFAALCSVTVGEYIRYRKLTLAGEEIITSDTKIIDIAFKYGYESHESFSRAFSRFHNVSPTTARSQGKIYSFARISVQSVLGGKKPKKIEINKSNKMEVLVMSEPALKVYQTHRDEHYVLGMENKKSSLITNPNCGACWDEFFQMNAPEKIRPYQTDKPLLGVFCQSEPGYYNYLIGAIVAGIDKAPNGMYLAKFPASDYLVVTHEWVTSQKESDNQIGRLVGYAHSDECKTPDGFERYDTSIIFIENYNWDFDANQFRFEVWLPIRAKEK